MHRLARDQLSNRCTSYQQVKISLASSTQHKIECGIGHLSIKRVVQAVRPEQLVASMRRLASTELGVPTLAPQSLNFDEVVEEASASSPILFIVSAGGDPSYELRTHAAKYETNSSYQERRIAMYILCQCLCTILHCKALEDCHFGMLGVHDAHKSQARTKDMLEIKISITCRSGILFLRMCNSLILENKDQIAAG